MRLTKQFVYGIGFLAIAGLIVWGVVSITYSPDPTCTDGKQNQKESDIDCGGPCVPCELKNLQPVQIISKKVFKAGDGLGYAFEVVNPNVSWAVREITYTVTLRDSFGKSVYTHGGKTFIYAGELKYITEPHLKLDIQSIASADVEFSRPEWKPKNEFEKPEVNAQDVRTVKSGDQVAVTGKLVNGLAVSYQHLRLIAVVFNRSGSVIGTSQTELDNIGSLETKQFSALFSKDLSMYVPSIQPQTQFMQTSIVGDTGPEVAKLQEMLLEFGFSQRDPTGFYDSVTQEAVRRMQQNNNLDPTGNFDEQTKEFVNGLLQNQVQQPSQQDLDTSVDASKTKVFVEIAR